MTPLTQASIEEAFESEESRQRAATLVSADLIAGKYNISEFVEKLGFALTSRETEARVNSTKLLSAALAHLPTNFLNATQLEFIAIFYSDRLKDHHSVLPAVIDGIDTLVTMDQLPSASVSLLLQSFFAQTTCQSQMRSDRAKIFRIFKNLSKTHVEELKSMTGTFVYGLINSIDGERDPRNLDYIFSFMPAFIADFPLLHLSEEMFEILACYFPIDFNPSKNDPDSITRDDLAAKLIACLVARPDFAEWAIPLALEKLESDLVVAKLDSLELLNQSALKFPVRTLEPHFEQIWTALKQEVFPGSDNANIVAAALTVLRSILQRSADDGGDTSTSEISHNYQTQILGTILPQLNDVNQRLFNPATAIALVCIAGDARFAGEKILGSFLIKLNATTNGDDASAAATTTTDEQRIIIYAILAQIFKIISLRGALTKINSGAGAAICAQLQAHVIAALRTETSSNLEFKRAALSVLNECAPIISEPNRALVYLALQQLITDEAVDLDMSSLLEQLGALYPIELQTHCIDACIRNFALFSTFVKRKIYANLLRLVPQMAFTQRVLDLVLSNIFDDNDQQKTSATSHGQRRLLALEALNSLLKTEDARFIVELQHSNCLIDKLVQLAQSLPFLDDDDEHRRVLQQISNALNLIIQQLSIAEQYTIASVYLPQLNLQLAADLFVSQGLLAFLHPQLSLDDHFERLLNDLSALSLTSEQPQLREVAHHLLCSLVNKIDYTAANRGHIAAAIAKLKAAIEREDPKAVEALSWLAKGLIVSGFEEVGDIVETLAKLLDHPTLATAAALAFEILSMECPELHLPIVKFLFKQKFFHLVISKLGHKLETYCEHHLNAFINVLKSTPHAVLKMNIEKVGPILFKSLDSTQVHTLCISLEICENFIRNQDEYFRNHLNHIIPSCLQLCTYKNAMQVRITALNLLYDITKYPTFVLLPHQTDVELDLAKALDDPKRLVRNAAVRARNAWFLIGAPNTE